MSLQSLLRVLLAVLLAALVAFGPSSWADAADAGPFDIARLMQLLGEAPESEVAYTEKKYSSLLAEPVVSSGTLRFRRPDTVEKNMTAPRTERFRIAGEDLVMVRNGAERRFPISSQPLLSAFAASLRGVLGGDAALLRKHYRMTLEGVEQAWRLELLPVDAEITRYVERILVSGRAGRIELIETRESSGDRTVLQVR
jgi:hypothetical protein